MLQHMQSHPSQSIRPRMPGLYGYKALIYLGYVTSPERFDLAVRAANKTRRLWPEEIQLIIAIDDKRMQPWLNASPDCCFHAPDRLLHVIDDYRRSGSLLTLEHNESDGNAALHALASGVPLDALNFSALHKDGVRPGHGDAFLGVGRARERPN